MGRNVQSFKLVDYSGVTGAVTGEQEVVVAVE